MIYIKFPQGKSCHFIFSWTGETNVWFYTMEQPISYHEWSWHQFQRNKSKEETNQVSLAVYKVRIGTSTTCLQTAFVSEDTGLQHFPKLAFNYELLMTTTWVSCFLFKHILSQRSTQVLQNSLVNKKYYVSIFRGRIMSWNIDCGVEQNRFQVPALRLFSFVILGIS